MFHLKTASKNWWDLTGSYRIWWVLWAMWLRGSCASHPDSCPAKLQPAEKAHEASATAGRKQIQIPWITAGTRLEREAETLMGRAKPSDQIRFASLPLLTICDHVCLWISVSVSISLYCMYINARLNLFPSCLLYLFALIDSPINLNKNMQP